ncbi:MAG: ATP-dependent RNA helicase HrpA [Proteobacteria bacterium]|nr:ATP-dependent RNA helicase HrpA [Pseudomonadota bacterium]
MSLPDSLEKIKYPPELPITGHRQEIVDAIRAHQVLIIAGDTGSGKTTQLPKMCLEAGRGIKGMIGCTQPRRIAAVTIAARVSEELGPQGPQLVGYKIRFQDKTRKYHKIKFMTDGILLAEAQQDRYMQAYDTIIVDEAHERSLNIDFLLGMLKRLLARRKNLKVIITSATIDTEKFSKNFNNAPVIQVSGRTYPVEVRYQENGDDQDDAAYVELAVKAVGEIRRKEAPGDILVFMPTERDIRETVEALEGDLQAREPGSARQNWPKNMLIMPLFGRLSPKDQRRIFQPVTGAKIVVATNVAETSVTVPGIRYVIDTGLARISGYNPRARTTKLPISPISRASADQRKGRCGRISPGICYRLYSEESYNNRQEFTVPEILRSNLSEVILRMIYLQLGDPVSFPFVDPPSSRALKDGYNLLKELGAIDSHRRLTEHGKLMAILPLDPRISRMILEARDLNALAEVTIIAAALSIQDPRIRPVESEKEADQVHAAFADPGSDFLTLLNIWKRYMNMVDKDYTRTQRRKFCKQNFLSFQRMRELRDVHDQIVSILDDEGGFIRNTRPADPEAVHRALLSGNLRNIALKKEKNIYQGAQGKEVMIFPGSGQFGKAGQWIMAAEFVETSRLFARTVAAIKPEWIEPLAQGLTRSSYSSPHWEKKRGQVVAFEKVTLFGLVIIAKRTINYGKIRPDEARDIFIWTALIEGELAGDFSFHRQNISLIARVQGMEDRVRQRDILVDDQALYAFYDQRLPQDVWDRAGLQRFLNNKGADDFLVMKEEEIVNREPSRQLIEQFPKTLKTGEFEFTLSYRFAPGSEEDGVSVEIPLSLVPYVDPEFFEWLVPGMLLEKNIALLKGLPKNLRRQLVPIPQTAEQLVGNLTLYQGSLLSALEDAIARKFNVLVDRRHWPIGNLPDHFRMRFILLDGAGRQIKATRNFIELRGDNRQAAGDVTQAVKKQWEREDIKQWDFQDLPERIPVIGKGGALTGYFFPGLLAVDNNVSIRLFPDQQQCREETRKGLLALYLTNFQKKGAFIKDMHFSRNYWALYEGFGTHDEFNQGLVALIFNSIFDLGKGLIPDKATYEQTLTAVREKGLYSLGNQIKEVVFTALHERRKVFDCISQYESMKATPLNQSKFLEFREVAKNILPFDFFETFTVEDVLAVARYFKALCLRIERAHSDPAKDIAKAAQVQPYLARLERFEKQLKACADDFFASYEKKKDLVGQYRKMIEEFRISLFAQQMKTAFPVSEKRLEKLSMEVEKALV